MDLTPALTEEAQTHSVAEISIEPNPVSIMSTIGGACTCVACTAAAENALSYTETPGFGWPDNNKKNTRYTPPQPDADTFATQQVFLDSLAPIPIESVDENSEKCPICWKPYGGAADPGFDNSEQPVRLQCRHTFGDKCLRSTFALPGTSTITLRPLAFSPGSRGRVLGQRLHAFAQQPSSIGSNGRLGVFTKMLAAKSDSLTETFGNHWGSIILELRRRMPGASGVYKITLLENAMILDRETVNTDPPALPLGTPEVFNGFEILQAFDSLLPIIHPSMDSPSLPLPDPEELEKQQKKAKDMAEERDKKLAEMFKAERELQERNERKLNSMLAMELTQVYSDYLRHCITTEETTEESERRASSHRKYFVNASVLVHKKNLKQSSYEVDSLDRYISPVFQQEDDNSDTDGHESGDSNGFAFDSLFPVIFRKICSGCSTPRTKIPSGLVIPISLWRKNSRKIPDDCPICHKILFHKENYRQKLPYLECDTSSASNVP